ncbi:MAG: sulfite exporter TauE/SafE family protein, partial [Verrucomicrobiales bacterium]|nr:sulfite exporter TauE/SafE family protein [Verrucomicrobiales bacterium]
MSRRPLDFYFIALIWILWTGAMSIGGRWILFEENWFMSVTMAIGSFIAGSTSQGGGAVAFPVMTLGFDIAPKGARDFSMMIQSIGMTSASVAIFWRRIPVEKTALWVAGIAGAVGVIIGLEYVQKWFAPNPTKVFFVSLWLAFGFALWRINRVSGKIRRRELSDKSLRAMLFLALSGLLGGVISGLLGSGLDILVFALLVLGFRLCETVATPTSVILMAANSLVGFTWRSFGGGGSPIAPEIWNYWWVCVPIV